MTANATLSDWFDRRRDAVEDMLDLTRTLTVSLQPMDIIAAQLRFASLSSARLAADMIACQDLTREAFGWWRGIAPLDWAGASAASRTAATTRAAGQPLREAPGAREAQS